MTTRGESRKIAYQYIVKQSKKLNLRLSLTSDEVLKDINISLNELIKLKEGLDDPSPELVQALKKLLLGVATVVEIDKYLVRPFQPET
ncbi:MAG: hypothetical protein KAT53_00015 [Dehalococcoidia bacterium]|nr:hypothetical protein [Dehalococcoidia bacterium]